jgi:hypothetical protein
MTGTRPSRAHASSVLGLRVSRAAACRASRSSSSDPAHSGFPRTDGASPSLPQAAPKKWALMSSRSLGRVTTRFRLRGRSLILCSRAGSLDMGQRWGNTPHPRCFRRYLSSSLRLTRVREPSLYLARRPWESRSSTRCRLQRRSSAASTTDSHGDTESLAAATPSNRSFTRSSTSSSSAVTSSAERAERKDSPLARRSRRRARFLRCFSAAASGCSRRQRRSRHVDEQTARWRPSSCAGHSEQ